MTLCGDSTVFVGPDSLKHVILSILLPGTNSSISYYISLGLVRIEGKIIGNTHSPSETYYPVSKMGEACFSVAVSVSFILIHVDETHSK